MNKRRIFRDKGRESALEADLAQEIKDRNARKDARLRVPLRELVACMFELRSMAERNSRPPCVRCGADTPEQASTMCRPIDCDCPGCKLWPDAGEQK